MVDLGYCRLCAEVKECSTLVIIKKNENDSSTNMCEKILQCFQIQILLEDPLPKTICLECCTQTNVTYEFYQKVQKAQEFLRNVIFNSTVNTNNPNVQYTTDENKAQNDINIDSQNNLDLVPKVEIVEECEPDIDIAQSPAQDENSSSESSKKKSTAKNRNKKNNHRKTRKTKKKDNISKKSTKKISEGWEEDYNSWHCSKCINEFKTVGELIEHSKDIHGDPPEYKCPECSKTFEEYPLFNRHMIKHKNQDKFRCDTCSRTFSFNSSLKRHIQVVHEQDPRLIRICKICGKEFKSPSSYEYHTKYSHLSPENKYECDICKRRLASKASLVAHKKVHDDSTKIHVCDQCGAGFRIKTSLKNHMEHVHTQVSKDNYLSCSMCPAKLKHELYLRRHMLHVHSTKRFECETCGKQFYHLTFYTMHMRKHTGERPFECQYCNKRFRLKSDLQNHTRQHTGERPYCCTDCNHDFADFSNYIKHMRGKHGVTSFKNVKKIKS